MAVLEARDSEGQVLYGASMDELAERTRYAGDQYTSWSVYEVAPTAAGTEPEKTYFGYMIDRQFVSLDEIDAERTAEPGPDAEDPYRAYDAGSSYEEMAADHEDQTGDRDDGPVWAQMSAEPPHPPRTLADSERGNYLDEHL